MARETAAEFEARMKRMELLACPTDDDILFFNQQIEVVNAYGMNYREGLEFIIRMPHGGAH